MFRAEGSFLEFRGLGFRVQGLVLLGLRAVGVLLFGQLCALSALGAWMMGRCFPLAILDWYPNLTEDLRGHLQTTLYVTIKILLVPHTHKN